MPEQIHGNEKRLRKTMERIRQAPVSRISRKDKQLLEDFHDYCYSTNLTATRIFRYMITLWKLTEYKDKGFGDMEKRDIQRLVSKVNQKDYSSHTKKDYRIALKKFYQWLEGDPTTSEYPDKVKWIKTTLEENGKKLPEGILSKEDVKAMIRAAGNTRNRALLSVLYESGCRIGEILNLKWRHVDVTPREGVKITVYGKTGSRKLLLVSSAPELRKWKQRYPLKLKDDSHVWITLKNNGYKDFGDVLNYDSVRFLLRRIAKKAGVTKDVNPHSFRHTRATHLASHLTEAQMCEFFGWVQGSKQPSTYVHLSGRDLDSAIRRMYGLEESEDEDDSFDVLRCPECGKEYGPAAQSCECGHEFGKDMEDKIMDIIKNDPEKWGSVLLDAMEKSKVSGK